MPSLSSSLVGMAAGFWLLIPMAALVGGRRPSHTAGSTRLAWALGSCWGLPSVSMMHAQAHDGRTWHPDGAVRPPAASCLLLRRYPCSVTTPTEAHSATITQRPTEEHSAAVQRYLTQEFPGSGQSSW